MWINFLRKLAEYLCCCAVLSHSVVPNSLWPPWTVTYQASLSMGILQARILKLVACPPPGDLLNTGSNRGLLHSRKILYHLSHQRSPWILEWIAYPFSRGSSLPQSWTHYITSLCLCFLVCKPELIHRVVKIKRVSTDKELAAGWRCSSLLQLHLSLLKNLFSFL